MFKYLSVFFFLFFSTVTFADTLFQKHNKWTIGLIASPTLTPESGYDTMKLRAGAYLGYSLYKIYEDQTIKEKVLSTKKMPITRIGIIGAGFINSSIVGVFLPIGFEVHENVFISPGVALGKSPYTIITLSVEF